MKIQKFICVIPYLYDFFFHGKQIEKVFVALLMQLQWMSSDAYKLKKDAKAQ